MPTKPKSLAQRTRKGQANRDYDQHRKITPHLAAAKKIRSSGNWQKVRLVVLNRDPLCVVCDKYGKITAAVDVDHIEPLALRPDLAFDISNLQGLCRACHNKKTTEETLNG